VNADRVYRAVVRGTKSAGDALLLVPRHQILNVDPVDLPVSPRWKLPEVNPLAKGPVIQSQVFRGHRQAHRPRLVSGWILNPAVGSRLGVSAHRRYACSFFTA
jgi:hypothetical protein